MSVVPGTATGTVVVDRQFFQGKEIRNLTITFERGNLTNMMADAGLEPLKALYDAAGPGSENNVAYGLSSHLPGSTLMVDGKPLVEKGMLKMLTL